MKNFLKLIIFMAVITAVSACAYAEEIVVWNMSDRGGYPSEKVLG